MDGAELVAMGVLGALLRWPDPTDVPAEVELLSRGAPLDWRRVLRFDAATLPVANLLDPDRLPRRADLIDPPAEGLAAGVALDARWTVAGEETPYLARFADGPAHPVAWDVSAALGMGSFRPEPGATYLLSLDVAQHRCGAALALEWLDAAGEPIRRAETWRGEGPLGGPDPAGYAALSVRAVAPHGAAGARAVLVQGEAEGGADAYLFFRRPLLCRREQPEPPALVVRPLVADALSGDPARYGSVPVGDALLLGGAPLALRRGDHELPLPDALPVPEAPPALTLACEGGSLVAEGPTAPALRVSSCLAIDGRIVVAAPLVLRGDRLRSETLVSVDLLDGERHWAELLGAEAGEVLAAGWLRLPSPPVLPEELHRQFASPAEQPFAAERYVALTATAERLAALGLAGEWLGEVTAAHAALTGLDRTPDRVFHLPRVDRPIFSVIVPARDRYDLTRRCLLSLVLTCAGLDLEVIVVDDGSVDRTAELERWWPGVRVVRLAEPAGFVRACNAGADAARGEYLVFLNNDTEPLGRWLEELHLPFRAFAGVGATGARLAFPDGRLQDAGGLVSAAGAPANRGRNGNRDDPRYTYTRTADYLSGAALMVSRAAWDAAGGFSPTFEPCYFEDTALAFQLREAGYATLYVPRALVIHREGGSAGTDEAGTGAKRFQRLHAAAFAERWRHRFRDHDPDPARSADRAAVGRVLVLDQQLPRPDRDAGSAAIAREVRMMQALGWKATFAAADMIRPGRYADALERGGVEIAHAPFHASLAGLVAARGAEFDLFYLHRWTTAAGLIPLIRRHAPGARVLANCADLHFLRAMRGARAARSDADFAAALAGRADELMTLEEADAVLTYSEVERGVLEALMGPRANVHLLPFAAPDPPSPPPLAERSHLGFLGSYDHPPNCEAVRFFLRECWPALRARHPELRLRIAGSGFERFEPVEADERVELVGWVPDALAFLGSCRVAVAPLAAGAGVKGKVVDALAAGTPGVVSPVAAEGLDVGSGEAVRVARTPAEWTSAVSLLLTDDAAWERAAAECAVLAARRSFPRALERFRGLFAALGLPVQEEGRPAAFRPPAPLLPYEGLLEP